jgi:peptide/nickel transport system substrate-binding protein
VVKDKQKILRGKEDLFMWKVRTVFFSTLVILFTLTWFSPEVHGASKELVVAEGVEVGQLDPHRARATQDYTYGEAVFDTLLRLTDGVISPKLAVSHRLIDDRTWEFKLRKGVKFHNGDPFTAKDVKFSFDRMLDPATKNPQIHLFMTMEKTTIIDDYTVTVTTKGPDPLLEKRLCLGASIIPSSYIEKQGIEEFLKKPIGTGPFKFVNWTKNDRMTLEAFKDYWGGAPKLDRVTIKPIPEASSRVAALETGEVDIITNVPPFLIPKLQGKKGIGVKTVLSGRIILVNLNTREDGQEPLKHQKVRQALNYAIDKKLIIDKILMGSAIERAALLTNYHYGFDPSIKPYPYDPERAKKLLAEAGYKDGFTLDFVTPSGRYLMDKEVSEAICGMLNKVGIKTDLRVMEFGTFVKAFLGARELKGAYLVGWANVYDDADGTYGNFFIEEAPVCIYKTPVAQKVEKLVKEMRVEMNKEKRKKTYGELQRMIFEDAPVLFLYQLKDNYGVRDRVKGFTPRGDEKIDFLPISVD